MINSPRIRKRVRCRSHRIVLCFEPNCAASHYGVNSRTERMRKTLQDRIPARENRIPIAPRIEHEEPNKSRRMSVNIRSVNNRSVDIPSVDHVKVPAQSERSA